MGGAGCSALLFFMQIHKGKLVIIIMINLKQPARAPIASFPFLYSSHKNYLKQISYKTDASEKGEGKGTESKGRPVSVGSLLFFHKHPGCDTDECRKGDKKEEMHRYKNTESRIGDHQGYTYIYKEICQDFAIIVCSTVSRHAQKSDRERREKEEPVRKGVRTYEIGSDQCNGSFKKAGKYSVRYAASITHSFRQTDNEISKEKKDERLQTKKASI